MGFGLVRKDGCLEDCQISLEVVPSDTFGAGKREIPEGSFPMSTIGTRRPEEVTVEVGWGSCC